ncbi:hypothetical protein QCA50_014879 [Cerrena zonata]|uniref:Uncharacterized protein n=1 Tax=Cerrena zonata TaxID=2478898 RepID=A0AAW0FRL5_9APHY
MGDHRYLYLLTYLHLLRCLSHFAACQVPTNRTIDDTIGDLVTGAKPIYVPSTIGVWKDATCVGCAINPDTTKAFRGTWNAATYNRDIPEVSVQFSFTGIAVYVYFILANDQGDGITTVTQSNFTLDGKLMSTFTHNPTTSLDLDYNQLVFSQTGLANQEHTLKASISGVDHDVYINFDYANYTFVNDDSVVPTSVQSHTSVQPQTSVAIVPSSSPVEGTFSSANRGAIIGGAVGAGAVGIISVVLLLFFWRRRRNRKDRNSSIPTMGQHSALLPVVNPYRDVGTESRTGNTSSSRNSAGITVSALPSGKTLNSSNSSSPGIAASSPDEAGKGVSTPAISRSTLTSPTSEQTNLSQERRRQRQQELERQMKQIQAEIRALNNEVVERRASTRQGGHSDQESEQAETAELREQIHMLQEHIRVLQQSEWAMGLTDEPPPEYSQLTIGGDGL